MGLRTEQQQGLGKTCSPKEAVSGGGGVHSDLEYVTCCMSSLRRGGNGHELRGGVGMFGIPCISLKKAEKAQKKTPGEGDLGDPSEGRKPREKTYSNKGGNRLRLGKKIPSKQYCENAASKREGD